MTPERTHLTETEREAMAQRHAARIAQLIVDMRERMAEMLTPVQRSADDVLCLARTKRDAWRSGEAA